MLAEEGEHRSRKHEETAIHLRAEQGAEHHQDGGADLQQALDVPLFVEFTQAIGDLLVTDGAERADALRAICREGVDLLVAHGGQGDVPVSMVSPEFADMRFAITQGGCTSGNTASYEVLQEESAFLAGVLAGLASRTRVVAHTCRVRRCARG